MFTAQGRRAASGAITIAQQLGVTVGGIDPTTGSQFQADFLLSDQVLSIAITHPLLADSSDRSKSTNDQSIEDRWLSLSGKRASPAQHARLIRRFRGTIEAAVNPKTSIVGLNVSSDDPTIAARTGSLLLWLLDSLNQASLANQAVAERRFFGERSRDLGEAVKQAEATLQEFLTQNRGSLTGSPQLALHFEAIQRDVTLRRQVYIAMLQLAEQALIESQRNTPAIIVFGQPTIPALPDARNLLLASFGAFVGTLVLLLLVESVADSLASSAWSQDSELRQLVRAPWKIFTDL
jgi:uncharacterized protein involved in exopolysaccharide biosynthesis